MCIINCICFSSRFKLKKVADTCKDSSHDKVVTNPEDLRVGNGEITGQTGGSKRKKKERGQNKKRPRTVPLQQRNERICPSLSNGEGLCENDDCKYLHDVQEYMKNKPEDIGDQCVNFLLKGKCIYGLECRFAKCHISDDCKNIVNKDKYESVLREQGKKMGLHKDLQIRLRKKQYPFPYSSEYLQKIEQHQKGTEQSRLEARVGFATDEIKINVREKKKVIILDNL